MAEKQTFAVVLEKHPRMEATGITIPFDVEAVFGAKRVPVKATVNGAEYHGSVVRMGGKYMLGIPKAFREAAGIKAGDNIVVTLEKDSEKRVVTPPKDLVAALSKNKDAGRAWEKMSYTTEKSMSARSKRLKSRKPEREG